LVSGELNLEQPDCLLPESAQIETALNRAKLDVAAVVNPPHRSVYIPVFREEGLNGLLEVFDFANPSFTAGARNTSTLPTQALYLMNSPFVMDQAEAAAEVLLNHHSGEVSDRIVQAYETTIGRPPTQKEQELVREILGDTETDKTRWASLYHTLFASVDFRYLR
jgi:hypothetical protein